MDGIYTTSIISTKNQMHSKQARDWKSELRPDRQMLRLLHDFGNKSKDKGQ